MTDILIKIFEVKITDVNILDEKDFFMSYLPLEKQLVLDIILTIGIGAYNQIVFHPVYPSNPLKRKPVLRVMIPKNKDTLELAKGNHLVSGIMTFSLRLKGNVIYPKFIELIIEKIKQI